MTQVAGTHIDHGEETAIAHGAGPRSPHWPGVEHAFRQANPDCFACPPDSPFEHIGIQVHHLWPYHFVKLAGRPDLELDNRNFVSAGETEHDAPAPDHHELICHGGEFKAYNPNARADALVFMGMDTAAIKADLRWEALHGALPKEWPAMSRAEKIAFRQNLDVVLPVDTSPTGPSIRWPECASVPFDVWAAALPADPA
jgi:hypothetical protein